MAMFADALSRCRYVLDERRNGSHRNNYDLIRSDTDRQDYHHVARSQPQRIGREAPSGQRWPYDNAPSPKQRVEQHRYRLTIDDRCPAGAVRNWTLKDINRVDVRVHLSSGSAVVVNDIPVYFVRQ